MKYKLGETIYFENGFKTKIDAFDLWHDGSHYYFEGANGGR